MELKKDLLRMGDRPGFETIPISTAGDFSRPPLCNAPQSHQNTNRIERVEDSLKSLIMHMGLPRLEIESFDGGPDKFYAFLKSFENSVANRLNDDEQKLAYLIHYCAGRAKKAIEHCVLLPYGDGYAEALKILKSRFGNPYQIMESLTSDLFNGPKIGASDLEGLHTLATQMRSCALKLRQLGRAGNLDSHLSLLRLVEWFPRGLKER